MIENYNHEADQGFSDKEQLNNDQSYIKWTSELQNRAIKGKKIDFDANKLVLALYRPFTKKWLYYDTDLLHRPGKFDTVWNDGPAIITSGRNISKNFSSLVTTKIPDMNVLPGGTQSFPLAIRGENLFEDEDIKNITGDFNKKVGLNETDSFAYVYGLLNSPEYQQKYANDLKKDLARIPVVAEKEKYVEIGKKLMDLHINYEEVPVYEGVQIVTRENPSYVVKKMKFGKKRDAESGKLEKDKSTIIFNSDITIKDIPEKAYEYIVNGRSAIEWIMDQYQVKTDKKSGITDDPNDFSDDPKYIFNLLLRIINVSLQTVDLVNSLPKLEIIE